MCVRKYTTRSRTFVLKGRHRYLRGQNFVRYYRRVRDAFHPKLQLIGFCDTRPTVLALYQRYCGTRYGRPFIWKHGGFAYLVLGSGRVYRVRVRRLVENPEFERVPPMWISNLATKEDYAYQTNWRIFWGIR